MSFTADGKKWVVLADNRTAFYVIDTVQNKVLNDISLAGSTEQACLTSASGAV